MNFHELTEYQLQIINNEVFECKRCGWVHTTDDKKNYQGEEICTNCYNQIEYKDEEF